MSRAKRESSRPNMASRVKWAMSREGAGKSRRRGPRMRQERGEQEWGLREGMRREYGPNGRVL